MPPIIPIVIGIAIAVGAGPLFTLVGSIILFNFMVGAGLSLVLGGIGRALQKKPNFGSLQNDPLNRTITVRQPLATARVVYGTTRIGGIYTYLETTGTSNEFLHIVITLSAAKLQSIGMMYFDGQEVPVNGSGDATGSSYLGFVHIEKNLGDRDQASFSGLDSASAKWTSAHRQRGRAGVYVRLKWDQNVFPHGVPNITFDVTGFQVYDPRGLTINDAFSRSDGDPGVNWTTLEGAFIIQTDRLFVSAIAGPSSRAEMVWNGAIPDPNQFAELTVAIPPADTNHACGVALRMSSVALTYYGMYANSTTVFVFKSIAGTITVLNSTAIAVAGGDRMRLEITGTTLTAKLNGSVISALTSTDSAIATGGVGIQASSVSTINDSVDNFLAGDLAGGGKRVYSNNSALCLADYLSNSDYGLGAIKRVPLLASMFSQSGLTGFNASQIVDGDLTNNGFHTDSAVPGAFLKIDLGATLTAEPLELRMWVKGAGYFGVWDFEYSDDNTNWFKAATGVKPNAITTTRGVLNKFYLSPNGPHRYWRLLLMNTPGAGSWISELALYESLVDKASLIVAANSCDETVPLAVSGSEPRYRTDGAFDTAEIPSDAITALAGAMGGYAAYISGKFYVYSAAWRAPDASLSFSEDDVAGMVKVTTKASRRELFNTVRGTFLSPLSNWQPTDFPSYSKDSYLLEDDGEILNADIVLAFTTSVSAAQRLAKLYLERARRQIQAQLRLKFLAYKLIAPDVIKLSLSRFGWVNKTFEVISSQLSAEQDQAGDAPALFVDVMLQETDATAYDWNPGNDEKTYAGNPAITVVGATNPQPVTSLSLAAVEIAAPDSTRQLIARLTWVAPADQFVTSGGFIHVFYKKHVDSVYTEAFVLKGDALTADIPGLIAGVSYDYKVVAQNSYKVLSADAILTSQVLGMKISGMMTYRPLTNPLTATDAGATATISIASFNMRIQGVGDVNYNSGSITSLSFNTLYYIYYDDANLASGSVTFVATTTKETALNALGRFFVGSILTPADNAVDTVGNGDGGSGAQYGMMTKVWFVAAAGLITGTGAVSNPQNASNDNQTDNSSITATANSGLSVANLILTPQSLVKRKPSSIVLNVVAAMPTNSLAGGTAGADVAIVSWGDNFGNGGTLFHKVKGDATFVQTLFSVTLPANVNLPTLSVGGSVATTFATSGAVTLNIIDAWLEVNE